MFTNFYNLHVSIKLKTVLNKNPLRPQRFNTILNDSADRETQDKEHYAYVYSLLEYELV